MQKLAIIGVGSIGIAAQMSLLCSTHEFIPLGDVTVHMPTPVEKVATSYESMPVSHSVDLNYQPTAKEAAWLRNIQRQAEWDDLVQKSPPLIQQWEAEAKAADYRAGRYSRQFTQPQPPTKKARKAARRRAKAGRKASR